MRFADSLSAQGEYESALLAFGKTRDRFRSSDRRDLYFKSIARIADTYIRMTRFEKADSLIGFLESAVRAELGGRNSVLADVYRLAGYLRTYQDRYAEAISYNARGLEIWRELFPRDSLTHASFEFGLGNAYLRKGEGAPALEWLSRAERSQSRNGRPAGAALYSTLLGLAQAEDLLGNLEGSIALYNRSLRLLDSLEMGRSSGAVIGRHFLAVELRKSGRLEEALSWERSALEIGRKVYAARHLTLAGILLQLGDYCVLGGDFDAALPYYDEARGIFTELQGPDHSSTHEVERKQARLCLFQGNPDTAVNLYRRVIESHSRSFGAGNPELASLFCEAGEASLASGDPRSALRHYSRALALLPAADRISRADALLGAGKAFSALDRPDSAGAKFLESFALQDSAGAGGAELRSATYEAMGALREREGNRTEADAMYGRALAELGFGSGLRSDESAISTPASRRRMIRLLVSRAGVLQRQSVPGNTGTRLSADALALLETAASAIARGRMSYRSEGSKLSAQGELGSVCADGFALAESLLKSTGDGTYREKALAFAEQSRAGVLLESLERSGRVTGTPRQAGPAAGSDALRNRAGQLSRLIDWTARYGEKQKAAGLREQLLDAYNAIDALEDSLARARPGQAGLFPTVRIAAAADIQSSLEPGACMVQFARGRDRLSAIVIGKTRFELVGLGNAGTADSLAAEMRRAIRTLDRKRYLSSARSLYRRIITPIESLIRGSGHLVIVPSGGLSYVPFEALIAPDPHRSRAPRFLVADFDISYSLSGTFYCRSRELARTKTESGMTFTGFAPVFRSENAGGNEQQHQYIAQLDPLATRSITVDGKQFTELPWSEEEIREIGGMVAAGGGSSLCLVQGDATEDRFKASAAGAGILHIATHGFIDEENPALSALLFSPSRELASVEDGVLYAGEVCDLRLNADLVVLSSCESGVGRLAPGEGLLAMSRGFLSAGARSIAYSLWKVNDRLTGILMNRFYRHILRGEGYAAALSNAKRAMIRDSATANPYFWAGFVLLGD